MLVSCAGWWQRSRTRFLIDLRFGLALVNVSTSVIETTEWPEFVFVTAPQGSGWVPARHLSASSRSAVVRTGYDTTELPTRVGEVLDVVAEDLASGWVWCRSRKGREGWVPLNTLDVGA